MASREKEICEKVIALVSEGETEEAIGYLERQLKAIPDHDPRLFHDVILLSNMYSNYERQKLRGTLDDAKGLNRITSEVLEVTERIRKHGIKAQATNFNPPPPGFNTSPDPLQPAYQQPVVQRAPAIEKAGVKSKVTTVMAVIGGIFVLLLLISLFVEEEVEPVDYGYQQSPYSEEEFQPVPVNPLTPTAMDEAQAELKDVRKVMSDLFNSGVELDESDVIPLDKYSVQSQLANTVWYEASLNYLSFDNTGLSGTYLNGNGFVEVSMSTKYGFWVGTYSNLINGDSGYIGIVPPGKNRQMTIYAESQFQPEVSGFIELQRR